MHQYVRTGCRRIHRFATQHVVPRVEFLEDRCTPASLYPETVLIATYVPVLHAEPGVLTLPATNATATRATPLVRTDLFGGAVDESSAVSEEPFAVQDAVFELTPHQPRKAEAVARPVEVRKDVAEWGGSRKEAHDPIEEYAACILLEYDVAIEAE